MDQERRLARERVRYEKLLFEAKSAGNEKGISTNQKELLNLKRASEKLQTVLEKEYPKYHELKYDTKIASLVILMVMIVCLGYGGLAVLKEVQKVQLSPGNKIPSIKQSIAGPTFNNNGTKGIGIKAHTKFKNSDLNNFYRPTELLVPLFEPRDGPISVIDTETIGNFIQTKTSTNSEMIIAAQPQVTEFYSPSVDVIALKPAWMRVFDLYGNILFENILDTGQRYRVPESAKSPMMRAGNSGSVYIMIGESLYGPVGTATSVARRVILNADIVLEKYTLVENKLEKPLELPVNIELTAQSIE